MDFNTLLDSAIYALAFFGFVQLMNWLKFTIFFPPSSEMYLLGPSGAHYRMVPIQVPAANGNYCVWPFDNKVYLYPGNLADLAGHIEPNLGQQIHYEDEPPRAASIHSERGMTPNGSRDGTAR